MVGALAAALLILGLSASSAFAVPAATGTVSGTVTDSSTHDPIEGVEVCAWPEEWNAVVEAWFEAGKGCTETAADGTYELAEVPVGEYELEFWPAGLAYHRAHRVITVESGLDTTVNVQLQPASAISGTVKVAAGGAPVAEALVCAYGVEGTEETECAETTAEGKYSIVGLPTGKYKVKFWPFWLEQDFAYQYWNHQTLWSRASPISYTDGVTTSGIDADLEPGATIAGKVSSAASGGPLGEIIVCAVDAPTSAGVLCTATGNDGTYELPGLPVGDYKVAFSPEWSELFPGETDEPDGYPTQFYSGQTTLAAANVIHLTAWEVATGIDARLGTPPAAPAATAALPAPPTASPERKGSSRCRAGFRRKRVKGKSRCVKVHRRHRHHSSSRPAAALTAPGPPGASRFFVR